MPKPSTAPATDAPGLPIARDHAGTTLSERDLPAMAVLPDADRILTARQWVERIFVRDNVTANLTGAQIKAAVDAADDWAELNASAYNLALPTAFRNGATTEQKTLLLCYVALKRAGIAF